MTPTRNYYITQKYGNDFKKDGKWFYKEIIGGIQGHTGIDVRAPIGTPCRAVCDGKITYVGGDANTGIQLNLTTEPFEVQNQKIKLEFVYFHLLSFSKYVGDAIFQDEDICLAGNTGKYTSGPHLHFAMKVWYWNGVAFEKDYSNGYKGALDPEPLLIVEDLSEFEGMLVYEGRKQDGARHFHVKDNTLYHISDEVAFACYGYLFSEAVSIPKYLVDNQAQQGKIKIAPLPDTHKTKEVKQLMGLLVDNPERSKILFNKYFK